MGNVAASLAKAGIVTGLVHEAAIVRKTSQRHRVLCHGPGLIRAGAAARRLVAEGAGILVSFGVAGALSPDARTGDLVLPTTVCDTQGRIFSCDETLHARLLADLPKAERPLAGTLLTVAEPALTASAKSALRIRFAADAVDMESAAIAEVASSHGLPFIVLRVVLDAANSVIPSAAMAGMRDDGRTNAWGTLKALAKRPADLPGLIALAKADSRARTALARLARHALSGPLSR